MRRLLADVFGRDDGFELAFARDGVEALERLETFRPDVITLDINMPGLNGLETLDRIMLERPCPVVMLSALTTEGADETLEALTLGAVDFVAKPTGAVSLKMDDLADQLIETVRSAASARVRRTHRLAERVRMKTQGVAHLPMASSRQTVEPLDQASGADLPGLVVIGASTGGPPALDAVLGALPEDFPWPVVVAQHMPASFTGSLARRLDGFCRLRVVEAARATRLEPGLVVVARGDADMILSRRAGGIVALPAPQDERRRWHPSVDRLVESARQVMPAERLAGVLLTGMGNDGATAMAALKADGGWTIAESEQTAIVWGMPGELARADGASVVADLGDVGAHLAAAVRAR
ncbi:chemotaxis-specific protein-glutamate methyltransferase CheB [Brevundimonas goettingensis]|nr:chemotaxis-specific protein-glutamate methyltransferase CheB [Brevundimonas goettingensis]